MKAPMIILIQWKKMSKYSEIPRLTPNDSNDSLFLHTPLVKTPMVHHPPNFTSLASRRLCRHGNFTHSPHPPSLSNFVFTCTVEHNSSRGYLTKRRFRCHPLPTAAAALLAAGQSWGPWGNHQARGCRGRQGMQRAQRLYAQRVYSWSNEGSRSRAGMHLRRGVAAASFPLETPGAWRALGAPG